MEAKELIETIRLQYKTFSHLKLMLQGCSKVQFEELTNDLFDTIFSNERMYDEFRKDHGIIAPVQKEYNDLCNYSNNILNFFNLYKNLYGF